MKIAICISGQPRNFKQSYESLKSNYLDKYDCDIYFHSWETSNFESTNFGQGNHQYSLSKEEYKELVELYKPKDYILESPIIFEASNYKCPIWRYPINTILSMYYSVYKSFLLCKQSQIKYDIVIRTRFDLDYNELPLDLNTLDLNNVYIPKWYTDPRVSHRGYCGLFLLGNYNNIEKFSNLFSHIISYITLDSDFQNFLSGGWPGQDSPIRDEYLTKWHLIKNNIPVIEFDTPNQSPTVAIIR